MASLTLTGGTGGFYWQITDLSHAFNSTNYPGGAGISTRRPSSSGSSSLSGIVDSVSAPSSGSSTSAPSSRRWVDYPAGTYTFYGWAKTNAYWQSGSATVTVRAAAPDVSISVDEYGYDKVSLYIEIDSNYSYYRVGYKKSSASSYTYATSWTSKSRNFYQEITGLSEYTSYNFVVAVKETSSSSTQYQYTTSQRTMYAPDFDLSISSYTSNSITISATKDSNYPYYQIYWRKTSSSSGTYYPSETTYRSYSSILPYTITGLDSGTSYTINVRAADSTSNPYAFGWSNGAVTQTTLSACTSTFALSSPAYNTIRVTVSSDRVYKYYQVCWRKTSSTTETYYPSSSSYWNITGSSAYYDITGLDWNTEYTINVRYAYDSSGTDKGWIGAKTRTTSAPACTASFSIVTASTTENSITVRIVPDRTNYPYYQVYYRKTSSSTGTYYPSETTYLDLSSYSSRDYTFSGLDEETEYTINVRYASSSAGDNRDWLTAQTETTKSSLVLWYWNASNGSATATQTSNAYTAVTSKGYTTSFSYLVWNDMCNKVKEVLDKKGYAWNTDYGLTLSQTLMSSSDKVVTAARWNTLNYNVRRRYDTSSFQAVSTGDIVYGSYFTSLMTTVNNWIRA